MFIFDKKFKNIIFSFLIFITLPQNSLAAEKAAIITSHPLATESATRVYEQGGTAADAVIAAALTLAVVQPSYSGLGGGGVLLYYDHSSHEFSYFDYLPIHPLGEIEELKIARTLDRKPKTRKPIEMVGVPGFLAGLDKIHKRFGKLKWSELFDEAMQYAENGFEPEEYLRQAAQHLGSDLKKNEVVNELYLKPLKKKKGIIKQESLSKTLRSIKEKGVKEFYTGKTSEKILKKLNELGSRLTVNDWHFYSVRIGRPKTYLFKDVKLVAPSHPSYGLDLLDHLFRGWRVKKVEDLKGAEFSSFLEKQMKTFLEKHSFFQNISPFDNEYVTLITAQDGQGNMAAMVNTLGNLFGSQIYLEDLGILMNSSVQGLENYWYDIDQKVQDYDIKKRPVNFFTPLLVFRAFEEKLAIATSGGMAAPMNLFQIISEHYVDGKSLSSTLKSEKFYSFPHVKTNVLERGWSEKKLSEDLEFKPRSVKNPISFIQIVAEEKGRLKTYSSPDLFEDVTRVEMKRKK